ncbi:MAG: GTPase ObgE [Dehalococcoidales bacterium]|jgi:GTP-binding protein|nr:GTPase ObgE [Dehalococcoidales bacterium]
MLDRVELRVKAGDGGRGAIAFRREKYVPFGGPAGGDGGKGGDVIVKADSSVSTLRAYQHRRSFKAEPGQNGMSKNKHGRDGADLVLTVPPGTLVFQKNDSTEELIADLEKDGQQVVVARGGRGGFGNTHFATAANQAPRIAQPGMPGQEKIIVLELRLIADAGIIGYPNVGKSSLLAAVSAANPKIADYPFTTLEPVLGVVRVNDDSFVLAEIPGLIKGAHAGRGLGHEFLRHAMRTRVLVHLVDGSSADPLEEYISVNNELAQFDAELAKKPQVVAVNKIDLPSVKARQEEIRQVFKEAGVQPLFISAAAKIGLQELIAETWQLLKERIVRTRLEQPVAVFRPQPVDGDRLQKKGNTFILSEPELERFLDKIDLNTPAGQQQLAQKLEALGVNEVLLAAGAKSGDTIITGNKEWKWYYPDENRSHGRHV